jgi:heme exporter protein D
VFWAAGGGCFFLSDSAAMTVVWLTSLGFDSMTQTPGFITDVWRQRQMRLEIVVYATALPGRSGAGRVFVVTKIKLKY